MTGKDEYREVLYEPDDLGAAAQGIIDEMGIDLPLAALEALLRRTRHAHRMVLSEWLRRNDPDWQPPRRLKDNVDPDGPDYDYGDMAGVGLPDWDDWWRECWGKAPGNPGRFRGTDIAMPPLVAIYHLVNRWWRDVMHRDFHPDFTGQYAADTDAARLPDLNRAAQIFLLVSQDAWPRYDSHLCGLVHDAYYRRLDRSFLEPR